MIIYIILKILHLQVQKYTSIIEHDTQDNIISHTSATVAAGITWVTSSITVASQFVTLGTIHTVTTTVVFAVVSIGTVITHLKLKEMKYVLYFEKTLFTLTT